MSRIISVALVVVLFCAASPAAAGNKCNGITCGYGGICVTGKSKSGKEKYTCIGCRSGYDGGDNKQCTVSLGLRKIEPKLQPLDQGLRIGKPRGGAFLKKLYNKVPSDLTKCVAKNCDMCTKTDQSKCVLCDDKTFLEKTQCVTKCPDLSYSTNTPKNGRICAPCASADKRECTEQCSGFRWENSKCIGGCTLPSKFDVNYQAGACTPGQQLAKGSSCEIKCANHALKMGGAELKYTCSSAGAMKLPTARCQTPWDVYAEREGNDWGSLHASFIVDWSPTSCDDAKGFKKKKKGVDAFDVVAPALAALKMPRADFAPFCHKGTNFLKLPKFTLASTKDYTLLDGALSIKQPVFYFNNVGPRRSKWAISMQGKGSFKIQDGTTITATLVGTFRPKAQIWTLTWLANNKWSAPFKVPWLEVTETAAVAQVSAANVTSLDMTGTCLASLPKQYSQRCTMDLLAEHWLLKVHFDPDVVMLQHLVAKYSKFSVPDLGLLTSLDPHGMITMYLTDTPQRVDQEQIEEGVTVAATTKFAHGDPLTDPLTKLAAGLRVKHTSFSTRFTAGHFAKSPAKAVLKFSSFSNHTLTKYWKVSKFGFVTDLQAVKFELKMTGKMIAEFGPGKLAMDITGTISKNAMPTKVIAVANRWRDYYGHVGLDLVDIVVVCNLADTHLSMNAKLPIGDVKISMAGYIPYKMTSKVYLTGSVAKLSVKQLRAWMGGVTNARNVISDAADAIVFPDNEVIMSSRTGYAMLPSGKGKRVHMYRGLVIKTKSKLAGLPTTATITYNSKNIKTAAMYVSFDTTAVNAMILANMFKLRDGVADQFALNFKDTGHKDLVSALQIRDVKTLVPIPEELELAPWSVAQNSSMVSLEIEWQEKELLYNLPATFATQQSSSLVTDLLGMLKFGCRTNNDCKGDAVCSHIFSEGNYDPLISTWSCVPKCAVGIEYKLKDAGCFSALQQGEACWGDAACTTLYCPKGKCVVRKNAGDQCNPAVPEACDSKYCCTLCGNVCEEYPLKDGFNCTKDADCKSEWCHQTEPGSKSCSRLLKKGATCAKNSNCLSNYCSIPQKNKCTVQSKLGGSCFYADECIVGLACCFECGFTCQKYPRANGLGCSSNNDCTSTFCHARVCVTELPDGAKCTSDKLCNSGYCSKVQGNTCVRKGADGAICGLDDDCKSAYCAVNQGKKCFTLIANGVTCASDVECESGFCNNLDTEGEEVKDKTKWKCAARLAPKAACTDDRMCKSKKCDVCSWWACTCT